MNDWMGVAWSPQNISCCGTPIISCQESHTITGLILGLHTANERRHYFVMPSLIGWAQNLESALLLWGSLQGNKGDIFSRYKLLVNKYLMKMLWWTIVSDTRSETRPFEILSANLNNVNKDYMKSLTAVSLWLRFKDSYISQEHVQMCNTHWLP